MVWNYRIGTKVFSYKKNFEGKNERLAAHPDVRQFYIIEAYYDHKQDADNNIASYYGEVNPLNGWENMKALKKTYKLIAGAFKKPVLDLDNWPNEWKKKKKKK